MTTTETLPLSVLFEKDETAWLEAMARLAADGRHAEMDHANLSEYLTDMAKRDRREVSSRLVSYHHLLKWSINNPSARDRGRNHFGTKAVSVQARERELHNHAVAVLAESTQMHGTNSCETGLPRGTFR